MKQSDFTIPCVLSFFIYAITIPIEQYFIFGEENCSNSISERISLPYPIPITTTTTVHKIENQMEMNQLQIYQLLIHRVNPLAHLTINYVAICAYKDNT